MHVNVARLIANRFEGGFAGAEFEVCVRDEAVLGDVEADGDGRGVTVTHLKVDVAEAAVEREFAGVRDGLAGWRTLVGVPEHVVVRAALEITGVCGQNEDRAMSAVANEANAGPDVDGVLDPVTSFGDEDDPMMCRFLKVIDRGLKGRALVRVGAGSAYIHGFRIVGTQCEDRLRSRDLAT